MTKPPNGDMDFIVPDDEPVPTIGTPWWLTIATGLVVGANVAVIVFATLLWMIAG